MTDDHKLLADLVEERDALAGRVTALTAVLGEMSRGEERRLLAEQERHMQGYLRILDLRLEREDAKPVEPEPPSSEERPE